MNPKDRLATWALPLALVLSMLGSVIAIGLAAKAWSEANHVDEVVRLARATISANEQLRNKAFLSKEKVCSETNQGQACEDLFRRLATNITAEQRLRLACDVLAALKQVPVVVRLRMASDCPAPLHR